MIPSAPGVGGNTTLPGGWFASETDAWRELAPAWNLPPAEGDPCTAAQRQQVQCFRRASTGLALVRQLGRPGVLTLVDASGQRGFALLTALSDRGATLVTASGQHSVPLSVLASAWRGDFATFWRVADRPACAGAGGATGHAGRRTRTGRVDAGDLRRCCDPASTPFRSRKAWCLMAWPAPSPRCN